MLYNFEVSLYMILRISSIPNRAHNAIRFTKEEHQPLFSDNLAASEGMHKRYEKQGYSLHRTILNIDLNN
jgi:hypothetical protein